MNTIPETSRLPARPVWARHLNRLGRTLCDYYPPSEEEKADAIRVLEDESNAIWAPELYEEAFRILDEGGR